MSTPPLLESPCQCTLCDHEDFLLRKIYYGHSARNIRHAARYLNTITTVPSVPFRWENFTEPQGVFEGYENYIERLETTLRYLEAFVLVNKF